MAPENAASLFDSRPHQGSRGEALDAAMGAVSRASCRREKCLRVRNHEADERGHGSYHHAASPGCAWPRAAFYAQAGRARPAPAEEGPRVLPQPLTRNPVAVEAPRQDLESDHRDTEFSEMQEGHALTLFSLCASVVMMFFPVTCRARLRGRARSAARTAARARAWSGSLPASWTRTA